MFLELLMGLVVIPFDRRFLECSVHPLHLTVRPGMVGLGQPMFDAVLNTNPVEDVGKREFVFFTVGELNTVVGQYRVQLVRNQLDEVA